jgi:DNA processing protein
VIRIEKEFYYLWLSLIENLNFVIYMKLLEIFETLEKLYIVSKNNFKFKQILFEKKLNLNQDVISNLSNTNLKTFSKHLYCYFIENNVEIIGIESEKYPKYLKSIFLPPVCIYIKSNKKYLEKKKLKIYKEKNQTKYASSITNYIIENKDIRNLCYIYNEDFEVIPINLLNDYKKISNLDENKIYIMYNSKNTFNLIRNEEIISGVIDFLVIPEADYNIDIAILVDLMLELGKNIIIFPNNIFCKNAYFSNYLIKNGAIMATNIYDVLRLIK